ncbi:MAG: hypothetical protein A2X17_08460 [Bacteroidetes bacterium GWF2_41_61]|jgi:hypothetical protein|nr:MAG: hypothetical protein A2X17_08460 [Bacteroidetes bacterium GWF2_41_61]OFY90734.1 MAG: hypothetical protein A2266_01085 [Bacteroidetes bacterium RIFOXYA12_FULL_40_10]PKP07269.1 MAG: hypothetical protein CVU10_06925 [Bacteroidetes bacterium HGW-Bacteroidetes-5]
MKINKVISLFSVLLLAISISSCNKELQPIVLTGTWELDTAAVIVRIVYSPVVANEFPETVKFLAANINKIKQELMKPQSIVFKVPNLTEFNYNDVPLPIHGTYVQENAYFAITNPLFPAGISGASDNLRLELYYDRDYLMMILYTFLTDQDDSPSTYDRLIETFHGVGSYKKVN